MGYLNAIALGLCVFNGIIEFSRLENTRQLHLFFDAVFAGLNYYFAARYFGWPL